MSDKRVSKITPEAMRRCAAHTLAEQLAAHREAERQRIIKESCERIVSERLVMPLDGAD